MRLLALCACVLLSVAACATVRNTVEQQAEILIDVSNLQASGPDFESELINCSDSVFTCFEAPGRFLMAFPKACPTDDWDWTVAGYRFRLTAPAPHYGLPSGGYFSDKYPYAYLLYGAREGFGALWIQSKPVVSENWGGPSVSEYQIRYANNLMPFRCE